MDGLLGDVFSWCSSHMLLLVCGSLCAYTLWTSLKPLLRWKLRCMPGVTGLPFLGVLPELADVDYTVYTDQLCTQHKDAPAIQTWVGTTAIIVIRDYGLARRLLARYMARPPIIENLAMRFGEDHTVWSSGLLFIPAGNKWRIVRKAFEAAVMHPRALAAQAPFVSQVMSRHVLRLEQLADSGQPVDMLAAMYDCTIDAIGWAAFGIDLQATSRSPASGKVPYEEGWWHKYPVGSTEFGYLMLQCAVGVMKSMDVKEISIYNALRFMLPGWTRLIRLLGWLLPDATIKQQSKMLRGLREACKVLVSAWRQQQHQQQQNTTLTGLNADLTQGKASVALAASTGTTANGQVTVLPKMVISNDGFLARLLSGQDLAAGEKLEDHEVIGNAVMMVVAGYETNGTAIATALDFLAQHPEAQRNAHQEVDAVLQGRAPTYNDLEHLPYVSAVFTETLRVLPSATSAMRLVADSELDLGQGIRLPKGASLYLPTYTYMRDPAIWPRAEEFLPERHIQPGNEHLAPSNPGAYIPFGHGARMCVGYKFAQMEARTALAHLLQRFTFETVPGLPSPVWRTSIAYSPQSLPLVITRRAQ